MRSLNIVSIGICLKTLPRPRHQLVNTKVDNDDQDDDSLGGADLMIILSGDDMTNLSVQCEK